VLLVGIIGGVASAASRSLAHSLTFGVTLAALTNVAQYVGWMSSKRKRLPFWLRFGPLFLTLIAVPLVMADLMRHVLLDSGLVTGACNYGDNPSCVADAPCRWSTDQGGYCWNTDFWNSGASMYYTQGDSLSFTGVLFTIVFTYSGFACLIIGVLWSVDIVSKLREIGRRFRDLVNA